MLHLDAEASYRHRDGAHRLSPVGHTAFGQRKRAFHTRFLVLAIVRETEEGPVYLTMTEEQQDLQDELRSYFMGLVAEVEGAGESESTYTRYIRRMGADGWLGIGWPEEYGGRAQGPVEQMIFVEESHWAGVPLPLLTLNSVGPTLMAVGTDEQKQRILPGILRGEVHFSIGYTEPSAGTDLASLRTRAVRDGDEYVINGEKIFTSAIQYADYVWLAARSDPDAPKHKGLSVFMVPVGTPGFHWTPLSTIAGDITSSTFYEDVRVPAENLVGAENEGWTIITNQLNHERVAICPSSGLLRSLTEVRRWAQNETVSDGRKVIDQEWVRISLARVHAKIEVLKLLNWRVAWAADKGLNPADASATKVYGTEVALEICRLLTEVGGQAGYLTEGSSAAFLNGRLERSARGQTIFTFGGGTNEIQRDIIAMVGLGMPRSPR
jgi:alkylation response protein AidB-like acyl-CoA dehydrogenase